MFDWKPAYALGFGEMDSMHREFAEAVDAVLRSSDETLEAEIDRLSDHLHRHFDEERQWMERTSFPSATCHLDEHAAVLKSLAEVHEAVSVGRFEVGRSFAAALTNWFPEHTEAMDMGLAKWMVRLRLGGAPVVVRREIASTEPKPGHP